MPTRDVAAGRLAWAAQQLAGCRLCPRRCGANRSAGQRGWCGAADHAEYFTEFVHYGEECDLVPSHTVYLTGCNLRCLFCHTADERRTRPGQALTAERLAELARRGRRAGARNLNLLGGEPAVNLPALLRLIAEADALPPIVWNTNLYCAADTLAATAGLVDVYLPDLKFGNADCAARLAGAADYWDVARRRLAELAAEHARRVILRHLVLPGHVDCCTRPVLEWLAEQAPTVRVSLKLDYLPTTGAAADADLKRFLTPPEARRAEELARSLGLTLVAPRDARRLRERLAAAADGPDGSAGVEVEVVLSPAGEVFLRHPTREATEAVLSLNEPAPRDRP